MSHQEADSKGSHALPFNERLALHINEFAAAYGLSCRKVEEEIRLAA